VVRWTAAEVAVGEVGEDAVAEEVVAEVGTTTKGGAVDDGRIGNKGRDIKGTAVDSTTNNNHRHRHPKKANKEPLANPAASRNVLLKL